MVDHTESIANLRVTGADRFDPVRFRYIEALAQRKMPHQGEVRRTLDRKLNQALSELQRRFAQAQRDSKTRIDLIRPQFPDAIEGLDTVFARGDFIALNRRLTALETRSGPSPLAELTRALNQHTPEVPETGLAERLESPSELKAIRYHRNTWSKLSVEKQVAQAMEHAPENAGPLNSQFLVLRSLELIREISPDYLNRFMSYLDTLLCLEQAERKNKLPIKKTATKTKTKAKKT